MRIVPFSISLIITAAFIFLFNRPLGPMPFPIGKFISPQHGFWQNAEPSDESFDADQEMEGLKGNAEVFFDERLVPHIFAENDEDLYFIQGYLHAKFRLFQMDLQTRAAEGRASEIAGPRAIDYDKEQRRLGMAFAAENAVKEIEKDPLSKVMFDSYTNGINAYIRSLTSKTLPLEYKLLNFQPAEWSNFRTAVLLKMMAKMLSSGTESDLAYTNAKSIFSENELRLIYPQVHDSLVPMIPKGTVFPAPGISPVAPVTADSLYFSRKDTINATENSRPDPNNGSNNWVVAGSKTQSGVPILSNDPHLEMSLPSIWYEIQLKSPTCNVYGVSLPGSPFVIIGFNDSIAWGVTNSQRDVKDYYEIKFRDRSKQEYWFNGKWEKTTLRREVIRVKGGADVIDTVAYTVFGPVLFDESFSNELSNKRNLAIRWTAHDPSSEGMAFYKLNRAKRYDEYVDAISGFQCPGQNFVFASKSGDIALWQQGKFPARWNRQGLYVMPGDDSSFMWQGFIPQAENQTAVLAFNYLIEARKTKGIAKSNDMVITTIVTTPMIAEIARLNGVAYYEVLTGFKWIAELIRKKEGEENYIIGGEESFGLMIGDKIRDKDGVSAIALLCEMAAFEKDKGRSLYEKMIDLYLQYGLYREHLISITKKGMDGQRQIAEMMEAFRNNPPVMINGSEVVDLIDYQLQKGTNLQTGDEWDTKLPTSNVLQFILADGSSISARPSGTEPKIKFYFSVNMKLASAGDFEEKYEELGRKIESIIKEMGIG